MMKIKLILVTFLLISLTSCQNESVELENEKAQESNRFLETHFEKSFVLGKTLKMNKEIYKISEVIGTNQTTPIGYVVEDQKTNKFLYFLEFNVSSDFIQTYDIKNDISETFSLDDFIINNNIKSINTFSFLDLIDVDMDSTISKRGRPFWGSRCGDCSTGVPGGDFQMCCKYRLWIRFGCSPVSC